MYNNYYKDALGVIHQHNINTIVYDTEYVLERYVPIPELVKNMSYLRWGYILGVLNKKPKSLLDIGFGSGKFLEVVRDSDVSCAGYDVFENTFLPTGVKWEENLVNNYYEVITFFDSLEHFNDINFIKDLKCSYIVISVPWCHYLDDDWFKNWKHRRENEHLHHFNDISLVNFMKHNNYRLLAKSSIEDIIRKDTSSSLPNILTGVFKNDTII